MKQRINKTLISNILTLYSGEHSLSHIAQVLDCSLTHVSDVITYALMIKRENRIADWNTFLCAKKSILEKRPVVEDFLLMSNDEKVWNAYNKMLNP